MQRFRSYNFPIWNLSITNVFFKFQPGFSSFEFRCFSEYYAHIFDKHKFDFPMQDLILNWCHQLKIEKKSKIKKFLCHFLFFSGQFWGPRNFIPCPSEAEKLISLGKNKKKIAITSRGTIFRADTKKKKRYLNI